MNRLGHSIGKVVQYELFKNHIQARLTTGEVLTINLDAFSGMPYTRAKQGSIMSVEHPGIRVGTLNDGTEIIAHNHIKAGGPALATKAQYSQGASIRTNNIRVTKSKFAVLSSAMRQVSSRRTYDATFYNCQHFVSVACTGNSRSSTVRQVTNMAGAVTLFFTIAGIAVGARR